MASKGSGSTDLDQLAQQLQQEAKGIAPTTSTGTNKRYPSCTDVFDKFWFCGNPRSQIDYYYKNGELEDCVAFLKDWGTCLHAKLVLEDAKKEKILERMTISKTYTDVNTVFDMKKKPSWENEE